MEPLTTVEAGQHVSVYVANLSLGHGIVVRASQDSALVEFYDGTSTDVSVASCYPQGNE